MLLIIIPNKITNKNTNTNTNTNTNRNTNKNKNTITNTNTHANKSTNTSTNANTQTQIQIQEKKEVVASAQATSNREAAGKYKIEESTIRAWVKKVKNGTIDSNVVEKKAYIQQKYSQQVSIFLFITSLIVFVHLDNFFIFQLKNEVVECAKTISRKELQSRFNVPGPTIRFSIIGLAEKYLLMISLSECGCCKHKVYRT